MNAIVLASGNNGKFQEMRHYLESPILRLIPQTDLGIAAPAETGLSFVENAIIKARHAAARAKMPAIADDSGLVVDALNGEPGIFSARYAGEQAGDGDNIQKLLERLRAVPQASRTAHFYCVIVLLKHAEDPEPLICQGIWPGEILDEPRGTKGFGYDPVFYVPTHHCSAAELDLQEKNRVSHRGQALRQLRERLQRLPAGL